MTSDFNLSRENTHDQINIQLKKINSSISGDHFQTDLTKVEKQDLFKKHVDRISIETSSYCNRYCQFCPNEDKTRLGNNKLLHLDVINKIFDDLQGIAYTGKILLHLYNEPLKDPRILEIIAIARAKLPSSKIWFNSNGDYLTHDYLVALAEAGISNLMISIYGPNQGDYIEDYGQKRITDIAKRCKLEEPVIKVKPGISLSSNSVFQHEGNSLRIQMTMNNFFEYGYDRGGDVEVVDLRPRTSPCASPFNELLITHTGSIVPCCNIRSDDIKKSPHEIGTLAQDADIFDLFASNALIKWRKHLADFSDKEGPCSQCTRGDYPELDSVNNRNELTQALSNILPMK